ncbi:MAG: hypothetical protein GQ569_07465 [Methylococcaceae bacterium]|nr:hypothetical protein [Methylococcaceae bacterium]
MAYKRFKLSTLDEKLGIITKTIPFINNKLPRFHVRNLLLETLADNQYEQLGTEKARSEFIINPVLKELHKQNLDKFTYFSGYEFNVDSKLELRGYCDFMLSAVSNSPIIKEPVFCLVEAKKADIEEGFGQCGAEMYAAQLFNERHNHPQKVIYGCVTNAFSWAFLKLEGNNLFIDPNYVPLTFTEPHRVLAVLQWVVDECIHD